MKGDDVARVQADRPNILLIQADQFRWDCLGAAGNVQVRTPYLDQLAAEGTHYTNAFCPLPICTPSRYSLLSGLFPHQHGAWNNRSTLPSGFDTFPRALQRAGYRTAAVGKMHFTPTYLDVGYERMELAEQNGAGLYDDDYHRELRAAGLTPETDLIDQEKEFRDSAPQSYWKSFGAQPSNLPEQWHTPLPGRDLAGADATEPPVLFADGPLGEMYMARTRTHKLLLTADEARCALFDLEEDPYELANRIDDPACKGVRAGFERALACWLLFDTPTPIHVDEDAAPISSPNVPPADRSRRAALHDFFATQIPLS